MVVCWGNCWISHSMGAELMVEILPQWPTAGKISIYIRFLRLFVYTLSIPEPPVIHNMISIQYIQFGQVSQLRARGARGAMLRHCTASQNYLQLLRSGPRKTLHFAGMHSWGYAEGVGLRPAVLGFSGVVNGTSQVLLCTWQQPIWPFLTY